MALYTYPEDLSAGWDDHLAYGYRPAAAAAPPLAAPPSALLRLDAMALAAVALLVFLLLQVLLDRRSSSAAALPLHASQTAAAQQAPAEAAESAPVPLPLAPPVVVASPYDSYTLTQGPHGYSYGHMAIDMHAGEGATVRAPIAGTVTALYVDQWGNPTLVIEDDRYQITMLHGNYSVAAGDALAQGDPVGTEGNNGYTMNSAGQLCGGRAGCGFHTHLNIFDKQLGQNVNPLDVIGR